MGWDFSATLVSMHSFIQAYYGKPGVPILIACDILSPVPLLLNLTGAQQYVPSIQAE